MAKSVTMTLREVYYEMRNAGIRCSERVIADGIACGAYPFGRITNVGETGRRSVQIFRVDFEAWLETKVPKETITFSPALLRKTM